MQDKLNLGLNKEEINWIKNKLTEFGIECEDDNQQSLFDKIKQYSEKLSTKEREDLYKEMESNIRYFSWYIIETDDGEDNNEAYVYVSDNSGFKEYALFNLDKLDEKLSEMLLDQSKIKMMSKEDKVSIIEKYISVASYEDHDSYINGVGDLIYMLNDAYLEKLKKMRDESRINLSR